jgi:hypothetical protein
MAALERTRLLILDDWGPEPFNAEQRRDLLEIVDDRYDRGSLIITSQLPLGRWHEVIGDPTLADAILDRIIHAAHRIELKAVGRPTAGRGHRSGVGAQAVDVWPNLPPVPDPGERVPARGGQGTAA